MRRWWFCAGRDWVVISGGLYFQIFIQPNWTQTTASISFNESLGIYFANIATIPTCWADTSWFVGTSLQRRPPIIIITILSLLSRLQPVGPPNSWCLGTSLQRRPPLMQTHSQSLTSMAGQWVSFTLYLYMSVCLSVRLLILLSFCLPVCLSIVSLSMTISSLSQRELLATVDTRPFGPPY